MSNLQALAFSETLVCVDAQEEPLLPGVSLLLELVLRSGVNTAQMDEPKSFRDVQFREIQLRSIDCLATAFVTTKGDQSHRGGVVQS